MRVSITSPSQRVSRQSPARLVIALCLLGLPHLANAGFDPCAGGNGPTFTVTNQSSSSYLVNGTPDPALTLVRGCAYTFNINSPGHPFLIKTIREAGSDNTYNNGVVGNGTETGTMTWTVPLNAPSPLFYVCELHTAMSATITVVDAPLEPPVFANEFE